MSANIFETDRLVVRDFDPDDWRRLQEFGGLPEVARMMTSLTAPWPEDAVKAWMEDTGFKGKPGFRAGIYLKTGEMIGFVGLGPAAPFRCAYAIDPGFAGRGYATEVLAGLMTFSFGVLGLTAVEADHYVDNPASGHVMRKVGFQKIGSEMAASRGRPAPDLADVYRLTPDSFSPSKKGT